MRNELLLLEDVECLGRSGNIVTVKAGYARNFLVPQKKAVVATKFALRLQAKLQEERKLRAATDFAEAEKLAEAVTSMEFAIFVKVDPDGGLYGSVSAADIVGILKDKGLTVEKNQVLLSRPIKTQGEHKIQLRLKEGVTASFVLQVGSDEPVISLETRENTESV